MAYIYGEKACGNTLQQPYTTEITSLLIELDLFAQPMNCGFSHNALMPTG
jgi:hypothetical protein